MIPIICGTFMGLIGGNQITIIFYSQLKNPKDFLPTAIPALLVVLLFQGATIGYLGYLAFGNTIKPVIFQSLPTNDPLSFIARIAYLINILGTFVIQSNVLFTVIEKADWYNKGCCGCQKGEDEQENVDAEDNQTVKFTERGEPISCFNKPNSLPYSCMERLKYISFRIFVLGLIFTTSILLTDIHVLITLNGSICLTILVLVLPVLYYNKAYNWDPKNR